MLQRVLPWIMVALLAPFGLRGVLPYPVMDILYISMAVVGLPCIVVYLLLRWRAPMRIGQLAVKAALLTRQEVEQILFCQKDCGRKFGEIAIHRNYLDSEQVDILLAQQR